MQSVKDILFELLLEELTAQEWEKQRLAKIKKQAQPEQLRDEGERKSA